MRVGDILSVEGVRTLTSLAGKRRLFQELAEMAATSWGLAAPHVYDALVEREGLGPTGVGNGVALPHARVEGLSAVRGLFIRLDRPLDFGAVDRQPVDLIFCLLAPASAGPTNAGVEHLKALALVSRTMRDVATCQKLRANADPATLHTILTEGPASQAA